MSGGLRAAKRLARRALNAAEGGAASAVDVLRRGDRVLLDAPPAGMRLGNLLYLWLQVHLRRADGSDVVVRQSQGMAEWWEEFPALRALTASPREVRFSDRREWDRDWLYQRFGVDYSRAQLHAFIRDVFTDRVDAGREERLVVNVRRGDFYGTEFEPKHGFNIASYLEEALRHVSSSNGALVVSGDAEWCREHLDRMLRGAVGDVEYAEPDALQNLLVLAHARTLIGANSTFSYWGAYIADALHDDTRIVMPRFHARMAHGSDAHQLDPAWTALDGFH
ncbi:alpha-1,2-fucosyltransferase [Microbacterium soli]|uniref:Alpha-1,2-fucosyltransferase n=1 Tax=Microbacterium soli TaxID=446075 RepID=A0ABP7MV97_9MICO